jgi:hypothetical protein
MQFGQERLDVDRVSIRDVEAVQVFWPGAYKDSRRVTKISQSAFAVSILIESSLRILCASASLRQKIRFDYDNDDSGEGIF